MTDREYEILERFSIMTVDGNLDDVSALKEIQAEYGRSAAVWLWEKFCKRNDKS